MYRNRSINKIYQKTVAMNTSSLAIDMFNIFTLCEIY